MSAIAHWIEQHEISTIVIGLVRLHLEKILPPRALWVPFELGRPLGAPTDSALQQRVLLQALQLVETSTPRQIVDFAEEDSRALPAPDWSAPEVGEHPSIRHEYECLKPAYEQHIANTGRTTVGVSGVPIEQCAELVDHVINNHTVAKSPRDNFSDVLMLRLAIDDIKACYAEAALGAFLIDQPAPSYEQRANTIGPSSRQIGDWFWLTTYAGSRLRLLRETLIQSDDAKLENLARMFIIPHRWRLSA